MKKILRLLNIVYILCPIWASGQNETTPLIVGDSLFNARDFKGAIEKYSLLIDKYQDDKINLSIALDRRALAKSNLKLYSESIEDDNKAIAADSTNKIAYWHRGFAYDQIGENDAAIINYSKAIIYYKNLPASLSVLLSNRSRIYTRLKYYDKGIQDLTKVIELNTNKLDGYYSRGLLYNLNKQHQLSIDDFTSALFYNPTDQQLSLIYLHIGRNKNALKKYKDAINNFNLALIKNPNLKEAYLFRGFAYTDNHDYQLASDDYGNAVKLYTGDNKQIGRLYDFRANAERDMYHYDKALEYITAGLISDPANESLYWNRAIVYAGQGESELAIAAYEKAIPFYANDKKVLASMHQSIASELFILKDYKRVIDKCAQTITLNPEFASPYYLLGKVYNKQAGGSGQAMKNFNKAMALDTSKTSTSYVFSQFYTGNKDFALQLLKKQNLNTSNPYDALNHYYNIACMYSLMNDSQNANIYLKKALSMGYPKKFAARDEDFDNIRKTPEYLDLMSAAN